MSFLGIRKTRRALWPLVFPSLLHGVVWLARSSLSPKEHRRIRGSGLCMKLVLGDTGHTRGSRLIVASAHRIARKAQHTEYCVRRFDRVGPARAGHGAAAYEACDIDASCIALPLVTITSGVRHTSINRAPQIPSHVPHWPPTAARGGASTIAPKWPQITRGKPLNL
jgi:hypothetical protein